MENEENICFDNEPVDVEKQAVLTLDEKLMNETINISEVKDEYTRFDSAKKFISDHLIPENKSPNNATDYIRARIAKLYQIKDTEMKNLLTNHYKVTLSTIAKLKMEEAKANKQKLEEEKNKNRIPHTVPKTNLNDQIVDWDKYNYPYGYGVKDGNLIEKYIVINSKSGDTEEEERVVSYTPFIFCKRTKPEEGKPTYYTIRYQISKQDTRQGEFTASMSDLTDQKTMQRLLTDHGILVAANQKDYVNHYISLYLNEFGHLLKTEELIEQNGWNEDNTLFVMGNNGITKDGIVKVNSMITTDKHITPFKQKGKLECWVQGATPILEFPKPRFMFYHGMSSALIKIVKAEQNVIDACGSTSTGKTATLIVVSSTMGNPSTKPDGVALEVGDSYNPLLSHAAGLKDMPVIFEEVTTKARREATIKAVYNIANGVEKTRAQKNGALRNDVHSISSNVLISCEQPISNEIQNAGGRQRVKDLPNLIEKSIENCEMIDRSKKILDENYGFFYPMLVQKIMSDIDRVKELNDYALTKISANMSSLSKDDIATVGRSKFIFASKLVAGYLCEEIFAEIGIPAKTKEETEKLVNDMFKECVLNNPVELDYLRALKEIQSWRATSPSEFYIKGSELTSNFKNFSGEVDGNNLKIDEKKLTAKLNAIGLSTNVYADFFERSVTDRATSKTIRIGSDKNPTRGFIISISKMNEIIRLSGNNNTLGLFEEDEEAEEPSNELKPMIKNPDPTIQMRYGEIVKYIKFMINDLGRKSIDPSFLELALGYEVTEYLRILKKQSKVKETPEGNYYI